jgi:hypothetical protein
MTAVFQPKSGPAGIGVLAPDVEVSQMGSLYEEASGLSSEELSFFGVQRALELARSLESMRVIVLLADEKAVRLINRETPILPGSLLALYYIKIRALMYTFKSAQIVAVPRGRVRPAIKLAAAHGRISERRTAIQKTLFNG